MPETITYPFSPITGKGLGTRYSSLEKIGAVLPARGYGAANLRCFANVATGNLILQDQLAPIKEANFDLPLGFIYNSQIKETSKAWQFSIKRFLQLPDPNPAAHGQATLQEEDGHLTTFKQDPSNPTIFYYAQESVNGTAFMRFDARSDYNCWILHDPQTGTVEYYDRQGLLTRRADKQGRATTYEYDQNQQLTAITGPTGNRYEIRRASHTTEIYDASHDTLLHIYQTDPLGRLTLSQTVDGYQTQYSYVNDTALLQGVKQSDNTCLAFAYNTANSTLSTIKSGDGKSASTNRITYNANQATVKDGFNNETTLTFNQNADVTQVVRQTGYNQVAKEQDITGYTYNASQQLQDIIRPDGGKEQREYDPLHHHLLSRHVQPDGQIVEFAYVNDAETTDLICKIQYLDEHSPIVTRYVYEAHDKGITITKFLRFIISPEGRVTEFRPDARGNIASKREYISAGFNVTHFSKNTAPDLTTMTQWVARQNPQQVSLTTYLYDTHGQVANIQRFAHINGDGEGLVDEASGNEYLFSDRFGNVTEKQVKQSSTQTASTSQRFDSLQRLIKQVDALKNITDYQHQDAQSQTKITYPNGRVDIQSNNNQGLSTATQSTAESSEGELQTRNTQVERDSAGRTVITHLPDGHPVYSFYDKQNRLGFTVTSQGIVTEYRYDRQNRFDTTIQYANPIDVSKLILVPGIIPTASTLQSLLKQSADPQKDRCTYEFFNHSGKKMYDVDGERHVKQYLYDKLNRLVGTIAYEDELTDDQFKTLQQGGSITLVYHQETDRYFQYFYDNDGKKIGEQDEAGYVTYYRRDYAGRVIEKIVYAAKQERITVFDPAKLPATDKDAHTYYYRDARGQCVAELRYKGINAQDKTKVDCYYTSHEYLACGLTAKTRQYANTIAITAAELKSGVLPQPPVGSTEDRVTFYEYDLLNRPVNTVNAYGDDKNQNALKGEATHYDIMGQITFNQTRDLLDKDSTDPDKQRSQWFQYDGWEQITAKTNPYIAQRLVTAASEEERQNIWRSQSIRYTHDASGLKLFATDPYNHKTYYYYDADRRPVLVIDPCGSVVQTTYNSFGEPDETRAYAKRLTESERDSLKGGFMDSAISQLINGLKDDSKDEVHVILERDRRGLIKQKADPKKNISRYEYNGFKQCEKELLPLNDPANPSIEIDHGYDPRGNEIQTKKTFANNPGKPIIATKAFESPLNKETRSVDERGCKTTTERDPLGRSKAVTVTTEDQQTTATTNYGYDAFNRITEITDSLKQTIQRVHDQLKRTVTIIPPIADAKTVIQHNVFNQKIGQTDGLGNTQQWRHEPDGKQKEHTDKVTQFNGSQFVETERKTQDKHDNLARLTLHTDPNNTNTLYVYDEASQLGLRVDNFEPTKILDNSHQVNLKTQCTHDAFGNTTEIVDPRQTKIKQSFDRGNLLQEKIIDFGTDPANINLSTKYTHDAQGNKTSEIAGDARKAVQFNTTFQVDNYGRPTGKTIKIDEIENAVYENHLDAAGQTIAKKDPNGKITRLFYNLRGKKRFEVNPLGGIQEWVYDTEGLLRCYRLYEQALTEKQLETLTDDSTLTDIKNLAQPGANDTVTYNFYDANGREKYTVKYLGLATDAQKEKLDSDPIPGKFIIEEKVYNNVYSQKPQQIKQINYASVIQLDPASLATLTTDQLASQIKNDATNDRYSYYVLDEAGHQRFIIEQTLDPNTNQIIGYVTEQRFDNNDNVIARIRYANAINNPADLAQLTPQQFYGKLSPNLAVDRCTYQVFTKFNKPLFTVDPEGAVIRYDYDENNNLTQECKFKDKIKPAANYDDLIGQLKELNPDKTKDRITAKEYDRANRLESISVSTGQANYEEHFQRDAHDNIIVHTDRAKNSWNYQYDGADRLVSEISPPTNITQINVDPTTGALSAEVKENVSVEKLNKYDKAGNKTQIIEGNNLTDARIFNATFDSCNVLQTTAVNEIAIDDPTKNASYSARPEQKVNLTTIKTFNAKHLPVVERTQTVSEDGETITTVNLAFKVYDTANRLRYQLKAVMNADTQKYEYYLTEYQYNAFREVIKKINYATAINIDTSNYLSNGIPMDIVEGAKKTSSDDRATTYTRDLQGNITQVTQGEIFYYLPNNGDPKHGMAAPQTTKQYNAFKECIAETKLINPDPKNKQTATDIKNSAAERPSFKTNAIACIFSLADP